MTEEKLAILLTRLHSRTMAGKVKWEETARPNFYQFALPEYTVQIGQVQEDHVLRLINADSLLMEEVNPYQLQKHAPNAFVVMRELHTAAKRTALNTEKALDDILSLLGEDDE